MPYIRRVLYVSLLLMILYNTCHISMVNMQSADIGSEEFGSLVWMSLEFLYQEFIIKIVRGECLTRTYLVKSLCILDFSRTKALSSLAPINSIHKICSDFVQAALAVRHSPSLFLL